MKVFSEFLNTSTIHGLGHISTARHKIMKVFWTILILLSFSAAALIIYNSFYAWNQSPFMTTSEVENISKLRFPNVSICPPIDTNTGMNLALEKSKYFTILPYQAEALAQQSRILAQDEYHFPYVDELISFTNIENIKNYYTGVTLFSLPLCHTW